MVGGFHRLSQSILLAFAVLLVSVLPAFSQGGQIHETMLPNGLKVLTKEVHAAPVVSLMVWYKVGSRNEQFGKTGISHLLEHMQFKGTKTLKKGEIDRLIRENGGIGNAATWKDYTFYYETLSSDKLDLAMRIEADRMVNSLIDAKEFKSEMTVVRSELEGDENDPETLAFYELYAEAFKAHPYHWPTIGWRHDVETITRDDIYNYYKTHYMPNNATVVIVGDFDTNKALELARKHFGPIARGIEPPKVTALEPPQLGERDAVVRKSGAAYRVMMGYHVPAISNPDVYGLDMLEIILSNGASSRLYKALVDKQLATSAWAGSYTGRDPDLFIVGATARDGVKIADVQAALEAEVERVKSRQVSDEELQKALNQLEAQFIFSNDSVTSQARLIGTYETIYTWRYLDTYLKNARKVTKADIQRIAQTYFVPKNRDVVTFIPEGPKVPEMQRGNGAMVSKAEPTRPVLPPDRLVAYRPNVQAIDRSIRAARPVPAQAPRSTGVTSTSNMRPTRVVLDNGIVVIIQENRSNPTIALNGSLNAGGVYDPVDKPGLASITGELLMKGTTKRTADQIAAEKDYNALTLDTGADTETGSFTGYSLTKNFDLLLDLLSDVLRNPTFPADELAKMRSIRLSSIKEQQDSPEAMATRAFYGSVFPKGHPYHQPTIEEDLAGTSAITRDDVAGFYKQHYGPDSAIISIVGDVDKNQAIEKIRAKFADWAPTGQPKRPQIPDVPLQGSIVKSVIPIPDKSEVDAMFGYAAGLKRTDPDFYAANVMNFVLGGGGALGSRLGDVIRDNMGLAYNVYSTFDASLGAGPWYAGLGTNPTNSDKAIKILIEQVKLMHDKGATKKEMTGAVDYLTGSFPVRLEKNTSLAATLHAMELYGLGMDYVRNYSKIYHAVTLDQVNAAAKKYLHPENYTLVIAGSYQPGAPSPAPKPAPKQAAPKH